MMPEEKRENPFLRKDWLARAALIAVVSTILGAGVQAILVGGWVTGAIIGGTFGLGFIVLSLVSVFMISRAFGGGN